MTMVPPTALVTGAGGFLGSHVADVLSRDTVFRLVHQSSDVTDGLTVAADLLADTNVPELPQSIDVIYHFAGQMRTTETQELAVLDTVINMAEQCGAKRMVYASSCAVYGDCPETPVGEDKALNPLSYYAEAKIAGENRLRELSQAGDVDVTVLRYFNPYGPRQSTAMVVPSFIAKAQVNDNIEIYGDGAQVRDFIHIDDLVSGTLRAVEFGGSYEVFNIGSGCGTNINALAERIIELTGSSSSVAHFPVPNNRKSLEVRCCIAGLNKMQSLCDWSPSIDLVDGLKSMCVNLSGQGQAI